ncbi:type I-U CRISPR-associated protein Cas7 [Planctomycetales bacterium]|nr:type I-U CRISPR-associated protein Cas7 [Planctomycetales bacterium]
MSQRFDNTLLADNGPAALVIREHLIPVEGADAVFFPATYADIGYNIDTAPNGKKIALIDSVGSQSNRIEPMFMEGAYAALVPQIVITAGEKKVNLLEAGHRAGDAIVRGSALKEELQRAFQAQLAGNAMPLAKIAPTSLVFGVWDSRDTQAKLPRLIASTIRAYDVQELTRSATYFPPVDYVKMKVFTEDEIQKAEGDAKNPLSKRGFVNALANQTHGGVIAADLRRDATLALSALKLLKADSAENTLKLRRYILGLALVAFTKLPLGYLRQGTILVLDPQQPREFSAVNYDGTRTPCHLTHEDALAFAQAAATDFEIGKNRDEPFDAEKAKKDLNETKKAKNAARKDKKKEITPAAEKNQTDENAISQESDSQ